MKKIILIIIGVLMVVGCLVFWMFQKQNQDIQDLLYDEISMSEVKDGTYEGNVETTLIKVKVNVVVKNHQIQKIEILKHDNGLGSSAESIIESMVKQNTYQVDVKSGATYSSQVIQSAVSQALQKGVNHNG